MAKSNRKANRNNNKNDRESRKYQYTPSVSDKSNDETEQAFFSADANESDRYDQNFYEVGSSSENAASYGETDAETLSPTDDAEAAENSPKSIKTQEDEAKPRDRIFSLDIGTRSVIGIVAEEQESGQLKIIATTRQEHKTRAMLDGQIHDVPQVAAVIKSVKDKLEEMSGPIDSAAVAAAGRALYTMTAEAEQNVGGIISSEQERSLDFAGVQAAQAKLASSHTVDDPTRYYCVGYSTIKYILDDIPLKSLVGQRGKVAKASVIATFLPRQVIDSMQSALNETGLEMRALTLEPIAAINVLIPPTMRHLNLVLVDIGAGTSDVAITKNGSVIAYGMVPLAGDEITEAISQKFLLDFNVAEEIKRLASAGKGAVFADILGTTYDLSADEIITPILENVQNLANAIAKQIIELNGESPQAVMLVGGGSMTPRLQQFVADALAMPLSRVAVRQPEKVDGIESIPMPLCSPDAVTPLGILKIASINTLHFLSVYVNDEEYSLFNFRELTVSDALLNAGIQLRKFNGRPGLGLMVTVGGDKKFFPGTMGTLAQITIDGEPADLDTPIKNDSRIVILPGENGTFPEVRLSDVVEEQQVFMIVINGKERELTPQITVNGEASDPDRLLKDGDVIEIKEPKTLGEVLRRAGYPPTGRRIRYMLNGKNAVYNCTPEIFLNDEMASLSAPINEGDSIDYTANDEPKLGAVLGISERDATITIYYNQSECKIPSATVELIMNGRQSGPSTILEEGAEIRYLRAERAVTTVSDALLAVNFQPPAATSRLKFKLLVNKRPAEFTDPVNNGDSLEVILTPIENSPPRSAEAAPPPAATRRPRSAERPIPSIPGLQEAIGAYRGETAPGRSPFSNFIKTNSTSETTDEPAANTAPENQPHKPSISDFIRH